MYRPHHALALVPTPTKENPAQPLPVSKRREMHLAHAPPPIILGPGRILNHTYALMGQYVENGTNRVAHKMGHGPLAVIARISDALGDGLVRQSRLDFLHRAASGRYQNSGTDLDVRSLEKDCKKLLKHAQPSESMLAQLEAFKGIIFLTTRYSGLRSVFLRCEVLRRAGGLDEEMSNLWARESEPCSVEWEFYRRFAIFCISDHDVMGVMDGTHSQKLCCPSEERLGPVERMLIFCSEDIGLSRFGAIRCLGGILELPSFWTATNYKLQRLVAAKLCKAIIQLVEDFDIHCIDGDIFNKRFTSDVEGIDILAEALISGVQDWIRRRFADDLVSELWFDAFIDVVHLFRNPSTEGPFPKTWSRASIDWRIFIKSYTDGEIPLSVPGIDEYQDSYIPLDVDNPNIESTLDPRMFPDIVRAEEIPAPEPPKSELEPKDPPFGFLRPLWKSLRRGLNIAPGRPNNVKGSSDTEDSDYVLVEEENVLDSPRNSGEEADPFLQNPSWRGTVPAVPRVPVPPSMSSYSLSTGSSTSGSGYGTLLA